MRAATRDRNRKVRRAALNAPGCGVCKPDGCLTTDGVGFLVGAMLADPSTAVRRSCAGNLIWGQSGQSDRITAAFVCLLLDDPDAVLRVWAAIYVFGFGVAGCVACDLTRGRRTLLGGVIHVSGYWVVEHWVRPLGVGTLVVKLGRHVVHVAELAPAQTVELGPLLRRTAEIITVPTDPAQVYVCSWGHGPAHFHFVVQPVFDDGAGHGPALQADMFARDVSPDPAGVEAFAARAHEALAAG